jgi:long-chain acyl-CoA synthetase
MMEAFMQHPWFNFYPSDVPREIDISGWKSVGSVIESACSKFASNTALTCMGANLSYRDLNRYASQFAGFLQKVAGIAKGDRVAIMLPNVMQFPIAFLGIQKIGGICVCTNPLYTPREMRHQFRDSGAKAIVIIDLFMNNLEEIIADTDIKTVVVTSVADQLPFLKGLLVKAVLKAKGVVPKHNLTAVSFKDALAMGARDTYSPVPTTHDDIAILQYTGGTTGVSKGAMLLQRNILANMAQIQAVAKGRVVEGAETVMTALPLYHIFALTVNFLSFLAMGERMILVPKPIPIDNVIKIFKKYPISILTGVNTLFNALVNHKDFRKNPPKNLKFALGGGMAVQESVNTQWRELTGLPIIEGFGLTEASPVTHVNPMGGGDRVGSIGIPVPSTVAKVVDDSGREVALGEVGELIIKGPQVMAGYWQRPEETAKTIKDGWLWTGDIARHDLDGFFFIVDRKKDMILVSGFNVYPNEVEGVIASHPKVLEVAVVGVTDQSSGEAVKAFVVPKDKSLTEAELKEYCAKELTNYKRPRFIEFRETLPKTNVGKILRRELRDQTVVQPKEKASA